MIGTKISLQKLHTVAVGKSRFTGVTMQKQLFLYYYLLIIVLFICITTVNLLLPTPIYHMVKFTFKATDGFKSQISAPHPLKKNKRAID